MTMRGLASLLIGLGFGLLIPAAGIIAFVWFHHLYVGMRLPGSLVLLLPFLLIGAGIVLLPKVKDSN